MEKRYDISLTADQLIAVVQILPPASTTDELFAFAALQNQVENILNEDRSTRRQGDHS